MKLLREIRYQQVISVNTNDTFDLSNIPVAGVTVQVRVGLFSTVVILKGANGGQPEILMQCRPYIGAGASSWSFGGPFAGDSFNVVFDAGDLVFMVIRLCDSPIHAYGKVPLFQQDQSAIAPAGSSATASVSLVSSWLHSFALFGTGDQTFTGSSRMLFYDEPTVNFVVSGGLLANDVFVKFGQVEAMGSRIEFRGTNTGAANMRWRSQLMGHAQLGG